MNPRQQAITAVRAKLGLSNTPSDWSYEERTNYNKELAAYILAHQDSFPPQDLQIAQTVQGEQYSPLGDTGYLADIHTFGSAFGDELLKAGEKVAAVGDGVLTGVQWVGKLIPFAAVAVALFYVIKLKKDIDA